MRLAVRSELFTYTLIGGMATLIDWTVFGIAWYRLHLHYELALILGYGTASISHYIANKMCTFKCASTKYVSQLSIYMVVLGISLACNMLMMSALVKLFAANKMLLRMITTLLMLFPNYLLHKHMTFSRRLFTMAPE